MPGFRDYKGCKIIIYDDKSGKLLAKTNVREFDRTKLMLTVDESALADAECDRVSLLVFYGTAIYELCGVLRRSFAGLREITLFHEKKKDESRAVRRYDVNMPVEVAKLRVVGRFVTLPSPVTVQIINISTTGVLLHARPNAFRVGTTFLLELPIGSSITKLSTSVVWTKPMDEEIAEYGCLFQGD